MEVVILSSPEEVCDVGARIVARTVRANPRVVLGLPTGETPRRLYAELVRRHRDLGLTFRDVTTFNVDELVGLEPSHPRSYRRYMQDALFSKVDLAPERAHLPDGRAADIPAECARYEAAIRAAGGIDLQLLGLGGDGHIAFNEPSSSLGSRTRIKTLADDTWRKLQEAFGPSEPAPRHVLTVGVATILEARRCLVLAYGAGKAAAVARMVEGPVTAMVPASALQLHPAVTVLVDEAAAAALVQAAYYRQVWAAKPLWQREI